MGKYLNDITPITDALPSLMAQTHTVLSEENNATKLEELRSDEQKIDSLLKILQSVSPPPQAKTIHEDLLHSLSEFGDGFQGAADALEKGDNTLMSLATDAMNRGAEYVDKATQELLTLSKEYK
jgi:hypothetical protein